VELPVQLIVGTADPPTRITGRSKLQTDYAFPPLQANPALETQELSGGL